MREEKQTFVEMLIGIVLSTIVITIIGAFFVPNMRSYILGTVLGGSFAAIVLCLLYRSIDKALSMSEESASKYTIKTSIIRLCVMCIALLIGVFLPNLVNVVGVLLGLLSLKFCAYLQPLVHKVMA